MKPADIKRIKHREVERVRHNQLQKLIAKLSDQIPDDCPIKNTQCSTLLKTKNYIEFMLAEYARIFAVVEVEGYSSSQGTTSSSQGPLIIDEDADNSGPVGDPANNEHDSNTFDSEPKVEMADSKLEVDLDPEIITGFRYDYSLPSFLLSPERELDHYDHFASMQQPQPATTFNGYSSHQYQSPPSPPFYSSQPVTSTFSYNNYHQHHHHPQQQNSQQVDQKTVTNNNHRPPLPHCSSCSCFNQHLNFFDLEAAEKRNNTFSPRDHLLTQTISEANFASESHEWF